MGELTRTCQDPSDRKEGGGRTMNYELLPWLMAAGLVAIVGGWMLIGRLFGALLRLFFGD